MNKKTQQEYSASRPPIVAVLGHVDHGKTSLLDVIRKANVAKGEFGGITQHIGAYQVAISESPSRATKGSREIPRQARDDSSQERFITFIDTPGHEAFMKMRSRGATVADIALLVVAADDSVKPQTKESIDMIKAAGVSMIVVVNKIDLPTANIDRVKQDLAKVGVQVEGFGGDVPVVPVSAKAGTGIGDLLDLIVLVAEMKELKSEPTLSVEAVVIETRLDKGKGMVASCVIKRGTLRSGVLLYEGDKQVARVRAMFDEYGKPVSEAGPSKPVEILGFTSLPAVGSVLLDMAKVYTPSAGTPKSTGPKMYSATELPDWLKPVADQEKEKLNIILKADTAGSMEAIMASLGDRVRVIGMGIGDIGEADVLAARSSKAFIVGFNVKCPNAVTKLAQTEKVVFRTYNIIYELLDELAEVVSGMKEVLTQERELGVGTVIAEFPYEKTRIAGTHVVSGRLARGDSVKIMRGDVEVGRAKIKSIRRGKDEITKVEQKGECGVLLDRIVAFQLNDGIIAVTTG
jgi:translation initiation factor IF-2